MTKTIWKYEISISDDFKLEIPKDAEILTIQKQNEGVFIWVLCDPQSEKVIRRFSVCGTGYEKDFTNEQYIGTFQMCDGAVVCHLFEITDKTRMTTIN